MFFDCFKGLDNCVKFLCVSPSYTVNIPLNIYEVVENKCSEVEDMCRCLWFSVKESSD